MLSDAAALELTRRFHRSLARISTRAGRLTAAEWDALGSWDERDIARFAQRVTPTLDAAKQASVNASAGYYSILGDTRPRTIAASDVPVTADLRAPFTNYWHALKMSRSWDEALAAGRDRAESVAADLVTSTSRVAADVLTAGTRVVGYRRVVVSTNPCDWCLTVATQRYRSAESANFGHDRCGCVVLPIYGDADPGQVINALRV